MSPDPAHEPVRRARHRRAIADLRLAGPSGSSGPPPRRRNRISGRIGQRPGLLPRLTGVVALLLASPLSPSFARDPVKNWFDDPFLRLSADVADCPQPAGPFVSRRESLAQSHRRAEKGTTAWLAGEAGRPSAYAYDRDIADALARAARASDRFRSSSLWATVQGRIVYLEGCLDNDGQAREIEVLVRALPHVQQAIVIGRIGAGGTVPYRLMPPGVSPAR